MKLIPVFEQFYNYMYAGNYNQVKVHESTVIVWKLGTSEDIVVRKEIGGALTTLHLKLLNQGIEEQDAINHQASEKIA